MSQKLRDILEQSMPKTYCPAGCDGEGTYPEADEDGDLMPAQCQYCYEVRIPMIDQAEAAIQSLIEAALPKELEGMGDDGEGAKRYIAGHNAATYKIRQNLIKAGLIKQ